jgi:hypothetical protein
MSEPAADIRKLPLRKVIGGAFTLAWQNRADFVGPLALPLLAVIACTFAWRQYDFDNADAWFISVPVAYGFAVSWLAIGVHRLVLLEPAMAGPRFDAQSLRRYAVYVAACLVLWALFVLVGVIVTAAMLTTMQGTYVTAGSEVLLRSAWFATPVAVEWVSYPVIVLGVCAMAQICLVLPAIAIDRKADFVAAWRASRGNGWRLALVFGVLPWCLSELTFLLVREGASKIESAAFAVLTTPLVVVEVIALSLSYRELTSPEPLPTPLPA